METTDVLLANLGAVQITVEPATLNEHPRPPSCIMQPTPATLSADISQPQAAQGIDNAYSEDEQRRYRVGAQSDSNEELNKCSKLPSSTSLPFAQEPSTTAGIDLLDDQGVDWVLNENGGTATLPASSTVSPCHIKSRLLDNTSGVKAEAAQLAVAKKPEVSPARLLSLPTEILEQIFTETLTSSKQPLRVSLSRLRTHQKTHPLNLLLTSRFIFSIALPIYYAYNVFDLDSPAQLFHFLEDLAPPRRDAIKKIRIGGFGYSPDSPTGAYLNAGSIVKKAFSKLELCKNLREVRIKLLMGCEEKIFWREMATRKAQVQGIKKELGPGQKELTIPNHVLDELDEALEVLGAVAKGLKNLNFGAARFLAWAYFLQNIDLDESMEKDYEQLTEEQITSDFGEPTPYWVNPHSKFWEADAPLTLANVQARDWFRDYYLRIMSEQSMAKTRGVLMVDELNAKTCQPRGKA